jgi:hypothetical protein
MPRRATSRAQFRLYKAVERGDAKLPGLSPSQAAEMTEGQSQAGLPERSGGPTRLVRKRRKKSNFRVRGK